MADLTAATDLQEVSRSGDIEGKWSKVKSVIDLVDNHDDEYISQYLTDNPNIMSEILQDAQGVVRFMAMLKGFGEERIADRKRPLARSRTAKMYSPIKAKV